MAQKEYRQLKHQHHYHYHHHYHHRSSHCRPTLRVGSNVHGGGGGGVSTPSSCHSVVDTPIGGGGNDGSSSSRNSSSALYRYPVDSRSHSSGYPEDLENQWKSRYLSISPFSPTVCISMRCCVIHWTCITSH